MRDHEFSDESDLDPGLPAPVAPPPLDDSYASRPGRIPLTEAYAKRVAPFTYGWMSRIWCFVFREERADIEDLRVHLWWGDASPAYVMSLDPGIVAAYSEDMDAVLLLDFQRDDLEEISARVGDRLLSVNFYGESEDGALVEDIRPGRYSNGGWHNFAPVIADLFTAYRDRLEARKREVPELLWRRAEVLAHEAMARPDRRLRSGNPNSSWHPL